MAQMVVLPAQRRLVESTASVVCFVGGYGSGKTRGGVYKALELGLANPGCFGVFVEPTYTMIRDVAVRSFQEILDEMDIPYHYMANDHVLNVAEKFDILMRSGDRPELLVGLNAAWALIDEPAKQSEEVGKVMLSRLRDPRAKKRQLGLMGTPEGFNWFHDWCNDPKTEVIRAKTTDNPFLPPAYIEALLAHLTPEEIKSYIHGEFISFDGAWYRKQPEMLPYDLLEPAKVKIFVQPVFTSGQLVVGVDTGGGLMQDSSAIAVIDKRDGRLVASWKSASATIEELSRVIQLVVKHYTPTVKSVLPGVLGDRAGSPPHTVIEKNGIGVGTYQACIRLGVPCSDQNTTDERRYTGLEAVRRKAAEGLFCGPEELQEEARLLVVKKGKFEGPKDLSMAGGFAYNWIAKSPYIAPVDPNRAKILDLQARLGRKGGSW